MCFVYYKGMNECCLWLRINTTKNKIKMKMINEGENTYKKPNIYIHFKKKESVINIVFVQQTKFLSFLYNHLKCIFFF
jgi:hypothetical protein